MNTFCEIARWLLTWVGVVRASSPAARPLTFEALGERQLLSTIHTFDGGGSVFEKYKLPNTVGPEAAIVAGGPSGNYFRLASATNNTPNANVLSFERTDPGAADQVIADFDFRMTPGETVGAGGRADGFGFTLLNTTVGGTTASDFGGGSEEPSFAKSVGVGFDIFQNDDLFDIGNDIIRENYSNSVSIHFDGKVVKQYDATQIVDLASGDWIHARVVVRAGGGFSDVSVILTPSDGHTVTLVDRLPVAGLAPYEARAYFGARSGGQSANHDLDNIQIAYAKFPSLASGVIEFATALVPVNENAGSILLSVSRVKGTSEVVTVHYDTLDSTAKTGLDYSTAGGTLTFAAGDSGPKTVSVPIKEDDEAEGTERFRIRLSAVTGGAILGVASEAAASILDNDGIAQDFDAASGTPYRKAILESEPPTTVMNGGPSGTGKLMRLATVPAPGAANHNILTFDSTNHGPVQRIIAEFDFRIIPATGRADGMGFALLDTSEYGTTGPVSPEAPYAIAEEPNFRKSLGIGLDVFNSPGGVGIPDPDTDINHLDIHNIVSLHFNGELKEAFDATSIVDLANTQWIHARVEVDKQANGTSSLVTVELTPCIGGQPVKIIDHYPVPGLVPNDVRPWFGARSGGLASLQDIDNVSVNFLGSSESQFTLSSAAYSAGETDGALTVTVNRAGNLSAPASVQFTTEDGTALAGMDYVAKTGTLQFVPGVASMTFAIPIINDFQAGIDSLFKVILKAPSSGTFLGGTRSASVTIFDDESAALSGHWSQTLCTSIAAIDSHVLPNGQVLYWDRVGEVRLFDPATSAITNPAMPTGNVFCAGAAFLPSGELFVAGGHEHGGSPADDGMGLETATTYNYQTNAWDSSLPLMNDGRWYPTVTALGNGDLLVLSGSSEKVGETYVKNTLPQVWEAASRTWRHLTTAQTEQEQAPNDKTPLGGDLYPRMFLAPDGRVFKAGPDKQSWFLDTTGSGHWTAGPISKFGFRSYGTAVMYAPGQILIAGGGDPVTDTAEVIDLNDPIPVWESVAPMAFARRQHNATVLPNGKVLVTGGVGGPGFNNEANAIMPAELWDPSTNTWTTLPAMDVVRGYHSTAHLLLDGRVLVGGGGQGANAMSFENNAQLFSPPYLFQGPRPAILALPAAVTYGQTFRIDTTNASSIAKVTLVRLPAVTHSFDQNALFVSLGRPATQSGGLFVNVPTNPHILPPGHWMLFVLTDQGVPSTGKIIQIIDPYAANDNITVDTGIPATIRLQANDVALSSGVLTPVIVSGPGHGTLVMNPDGSQTYSPAGGFVGIDQLEYVVRDSSGRSSNTAIVDFVIISKGWNNPQNALDVDGDGDISPIDAVLIINVLNSFGSSLLPSPTAQSGPPPFLDTNADGYVAPIDAVLVINRLNNPGAQAFGPENSTAEGESDNEQATSISQYITAVQVLLLSIEAPAAHLSASIASEPTSSFALVGKTAFDYQVPHSTKHRAATRITDPTSSEPLANLHSYKLKKPPNDSSLDESDRSGPQLIERHLTD